MPTYSILDTETGKDFEVNIKFAEFAEFLQSNPTYKQVFKRFPATGDPVRLGRIKPDDGFRDVLRTVRHHHKKDSINTF